MRGKIIAVHLLAAAITALVAWYLVPPVLKFADRYSDTGLHEFLIWATVIVLAAWFILIVKLAHVIVYYLAFAWLSNEHEACGLYIEAYVSEDGNPRLALMAVYFDLTEEVLKIVGHSCCLDKDDKTKLAPFAKWKSRAVHHTASDDHFEIFYVHSGDIGTFHKDVRGTTMGRLSASPLMSETGSFCDLEDLSGANLKPQFFEVVRARKEEEKWFMDNMKTSHRFWHYLKLSAPRAEYFWLLVQEKGFTLLDAYPNASRRDTMRQVRKALSDARGNAPRGHQTAIAAALPAGASNPTGNVANSSINDVIRDKLMALLPRSYAQYSNFHVAAAIIDENGNAHFGVNVENQSFPVTSCAEGGAISAMRVAGGERIKKLFLLSDPNVEAVPCGACRQRLSELGDVDMPIITFRSDGSQTIFSLGQLFPHGFRFR